MQLRKPLNKKNETKTSKIESRKPSQQSKKENMRPPALKLQGVLSKMQQME